MRARAGTRIAREDVARLTPRQEQVLRLIGRGYTNGQIADELGITLDGAKFHVAEIMAKLGVPTREQAVDAWRSGRRRHWLLPTGAILKWTAAVAAIGGVGIATGVVLTSLSGAGDGTAGGDSDSEPAAALAATPSPAATPQESRLVMIDNARLAACPDDRPPPATQPAGVHAIIDWLDVVKFNGTQYLSMAPGLAQPDLDRPFGRVDFTLSDSVTGPYYAAQDCDAAFLPVGTVLFEIPGWDSKFRIATAEGRVYQAFVSSTAQFGRDILDIEAKVTAIEIRSLEHNADYVLGRIDDPQQVGAVVRALMDAPYAEKAPGSEDTVYRLAFLLMDGTEFTATLVPGQRLVHPGLHVPQATVDLLLTAIDEE